MPGPTQARTGWRPVDAWASPPVPAATAGGAFAIPSRSAKACAVLIEPGVRDDPAKPTQLCLSCCPAIERRACIPAKCRGTVTARAQACHLNDLMPVKGAGQRLTHYHDCYQLRAVEQALAKFPTGRAPAMFVMMLDEAPSVPELDTLKTELPVEHQAARVVIGDTPQLLSSNLLDTEMAQQLACPIRIMTQPPAHVFLESLTACADNERAAVPDFQKFDFLLIAAVFAN